MEGFEEPFDLDGYTCEVARGLIIHVTLEEADAIGYLAALWFRHDLGEHEERPCEPSAAVRSAVVGRALRYAAAAAAARDVFRPVDPANDPLDVVFPER